MVDDIVQDELILVRTKQGQAQTFDDVRLDEPDLRLLRLVNGFTPFGALAARLDAGHDWRATADALLRQGLVEVEADDERSAPAALPSGAGEPIDE